MENNERKKWRWRLLRQRRLWLPTWRGWAFLVGILAILGFATVRGTYGFLAVTAPIPGGVLVVEGWAPDYVLKEAVTEFGKGDYTNVLVTGGTVDYGAPLYEYHTFAEIGMATLTAFGLSSNRVCAVPAPSVRRDRTYASAVALADWFRAHGGKPAQLTVLTEGPHARRSRLLFQMAMGNGVQVGVIAVPPMAYDPAKWWHYSAGVRTVLSELIAYGYARVLFRPD